MIFTEFLLAPTVPSAPRPKNFASKMPSPPSAISSFMGSERKVRSSLMPMVKRSLGMASARFSYTPMIIAGVVSLEPRP